MKKFWIEGILPAIVTPFEEDNKTVNEKATKELLNLHLDQGAEGFYVLGSTGEGIVMDREERERMCEICVKEVAGRKPIICHVASPNFYEVIELAKHAERAGADAIASVPPSMLAYSEEDIYNYYKALAASVTIPVIVYYFPGAQPVMSNKLIMRIFEIDNVTGVKWSAYDYYSLNRLKDMTNGEINILNGPDEMLLSGLTAGADAGIGATYNPMLPQYIKIYKNFKEGNFAEARKVQIEVNRVIDVMIKHNVIPSVKYATSLLLGTDLGNARYPMRQYTAEEKAALEKDLRAAGWPFQG